MTCYDWLIWFVLICKMSSIPKYAEHYTHRLSYDKGGHLLWDCLFKKKKKSKEIPVFHNIFLLNHTCVVQSLLKIEAGDLLYSYRWLIMAPAKACCLGIIIKTNVLGLD